MSAVREEARKLVDGLPEEASWDDLMYEMYVRRKIDSGLAAANRGDVIDHEAVKQRLIRRW